MSNIIKELSIVVRAAFDDTRKNIFRPIHNAKVILGLEHEPSIDEKIAQFEERVKGQGKHPRKPALER